MSLDNTVLSHDNEMLETIGFLFCFFGGLFTVLVGSCADDYYIDVARVRYLRDLGIKA